jgi:Protein of unknown function (DUF3326)
MIRNRTLVLDRAGISGGDLLEAIQQLFEVEPLRWYVSSATAGQVTVEVTEYAGASPSSYPMAEPGPSGGKDVLISLVPTGIGCAIGGYAGDAAPATALLGACVDYVVTNPNAVNASNFIAAADNLVYTEGYFLDLFASGAAVLRVPRANRVGVVIEHADPAALSQVFNVINTVRAVHGIDIIDYVITEVPVGTRSVRTPSGAYVGTLERPDVLLDAAGKLVERGATAIAVTTNVRGLSADEYVDHFAGRNPNPVGGAEAVVSHLVARTLRRPVAHAPMINFRSTALSHRVVDARGAGEFVSASGLASVLIGLRRAPQVLPGRGVTDVIGIDDVVAVVAPATALGGVPTLHAHRHGIPVVAVAANETILDVTADALGLPDVIHVRDYVEAAGAVVALRHGIPLAALRRPLTTFGAQPVTAAIRTA